MSDQILDTLEGTATSLAARVENLKLEEGKCAIAINAILAGAVSIPQGAETSSTKKPVKPPEASSASTGDALQASPRPASRAKPANPSVAAPPAVEPPAPPADEMSMEGESGSQDDGNGSGEQTELAGEGDLTFDDLFGEESEEDEEIQVSPKDSLALESDTEPDLELEKPSDTQAAGQGLTFDDLFEEEDQAPAISAPVVAGKKPAAASEPAPDGEHGDDGGSDEFDWSELVGSGGIGQSAPFA